MASDLRCELIPVHHYWAGYLEKNGLRSDDLVMSDARYPNELGHQVIAEVVMKELNKMFAPVSIRSEYGQGDRE